jgi:Arc/MetJ family transcription regulator
VYGNTQLGLIIMRTNIVIDDDLMNEAISLTGIRTKRELVDLALQELVAKRKKKDLFKLAGQIEFRKDFNHKEDRVMRHDID